MNKSLFTMMFLAMLVGVSLAADAKKQILRVRFHDGSYKEYALDRIKKISFKADPNDPVDPEPEEKQYCSEEDEALYPEACARSSSSVDESSSSLADASSSSKENSSASKPSSSSSVKPAASSSSEKGNAIHFNNTFANSIRWNGTSNLLSIESSENTVATVYVFGPQGICLAERKVSLLPGNNVVSLENMNLSRSMYIVRVKTLSKDAVLKIQGTK